MGGSPERKKRRERGRVEGGKEGKTGREGENVRFYPNFILLNF